MYTRYRYSTSLHTSMIEISLSLPEVKRKFFTHTVFKKHRPIYDLIFGGGEYMHWGLEIRPAAQIYGDTGTGVIFSQSILTLIICIWNSLSIYYAARNGRTYIYMDIHQLIYLFITSYLFN